MAEWSEHTIAELFDVELGKMLSPRSASGVQWPYLANRNVQWGRLVLHDLGTMHFTETERQKYSLQDGDVLVCEGGEIGRTAIWHGELEHCYFQNAIHRLRPRSGAESRFARHFMEHAATTGKFRRLGGQTSIAHLPKERLVGWRVSFPPQDEQRRIAGILDTLDDLIAVSGRLVGKQLSTHSGLIESGLDELLEGSPPNPLASVAEIGSGLALSSRRHVADPVSVPYLRVANVQDGFIDLSDVRRVVVGRSDLARFELHAGDVLMNEGGDFDKLGRGAVWDGSIVPCIHQNHVFRVRCDAARLLPKFLALYAASRRGKRYFTAASKQTTNLASINKRQLAELPVPLVPVDRQLSFIHLVEASERQLDAQHAQARKLRAIRAGVTEDLLTGRVRTVPA